MERGTDQPGSGQSVNRDGLAAVVIVLVTLALIVVVVTSLV